MKISTYSMSVETFVPMLANLSGVLDKASQHAEARKIDPATLTNARLAPDMFPLSAQVRIACRHATEAMAMLAQKQAAIDSESATFPELKALIAKTVEFVKSTKPSDFEGADEREVVLQLPLPTRQFVGKGSQYLKDWAIPHFYFHVTTAYDILRHNGVEIGKRDYLGHVGSYVREKKA